MLWDFLKAVTCIEHNSELSWEKDDNTLEPRYNAPLYNAISDTTLVFLGSQITLKSFINTDVWV